MDFGLAVDALRHKAAVIDALLDARAFKGQVDLGRPVGAPLFELILLVPLPAFVAEVVALDLRMVNRTWA
jgi:hypothetical protein